MEEFVHYIETPETSTMRINADVMSQICDFQGSTPQLLCSFATLSQCDALRRFTPHWSLISSEKLSSGNFSNVHSHVWVRELGLLAQDCSKLASCYMKKYPLKVA